TRRTGRGTVIGLALVLLTAGLGRWLLLPPEAPPPLDQFVWPLAYWGALGVIGPAVIAASHRSARDRSDLSAAVRRSVLIARWIGAYLGYVLAGLLGMTLLVSLWAIGLLTILPAPVPLLLFAGVLLGALFASYTGARAQARSALAIAPID